MERGERSERLVLAGLLALGFALSVAVLVLPGSDTIQSRIAWLMFPWGALLLGFGTMWMTRNPQREAAVGKALLALSLLLTAGILAGVFLVARGQGG